MRAALALRACTSNHVGMVPAAAVAWRRLQTWQANGPTAAAPGEPLQPRARPSAPQRRSRYSTDSGSSGGSSSGSTAMLSNTTGFLRNLHNGAEIFIVGTAHVSKRSAEEVRDMIRLVKPDAVMVELCAARAARMRSGETDSGFMQQMLGSLFAPGGSMSQKLVQVSLPMMYRVLKLVGMDPGGEFKVALQEADRIGARVVHGDRDVQATLQRLSATMSVPDLLRMMSGSGMPDPPQALADFMMQGGGSLEDKVEGMKTRALVREMTAYMRRVNPQLAEALIDERDQHMVDCLARLQGRVVAVVGLAHLDGIERRWEALQHSGRALAR